MKKNVLWTKGHKIKSFEVFPDNSGNRFNMLGQISFVKYFEDVIDPSLHMDITIADTNGLINKIPIRSGTAVIIELEHPSQDDAIKMKLIVTNISGHIIDQKREIYTLTCETIGALSNHTNRVWTKYKGSIAVSVSKILNEKIDGKINFVDTTSNDCEFYGNYRRPFKVISDLCRKAIPSTGSFSVGNAGTAGYLFFETQDGYNFRSIDVIFKSDAELEYVMTPFKKGLDVSNNFRLAGAPAMTESHDIIKKLRSGAFSSSNWYYDVLTRKVHFYNFKYSGDVEKANDEDVTPVAYKKPYSRIILGTLDSGTTMRDADGVAIDTPQDQARYQAQASARYSAMFSQILDITVPMNLSLRAGQVINIIFPDLNTGKPQDKNSPESGKYMIARLSHEFGNPEGDFTGLSLVRDSFTINE
mgnify:FL=1